IVDHTTTSAAGAVARVARWRTRGFTYVHAPVFMGPQNARESTGLMLISGAPADVEPLRPALSPMTGQLIELGERPDPAAAVTLVGTLFLMTLTPGLADLLALARALDVEPADAATLFDHFNPGVTIAARIKRMVDAAFADPSWELDMARKDARLM